MFVELEMPVLTEDMTAEDISDLRKRTKRTMVAQLVQLQAAYARLDKRTKSDDVNAYVPWQKQWEREGKVWNG